MDLSRLPLALQLVLLIIAGLIGVTMLAAMLIAAYRNEPTPESELVDERGTLRGCGWPMRRYLWAPRRPFDHDRDRWDW